MYKAGFRWIHFGIESGSQKVLENNNKNFDVDYAKRVIKEVKQIGFRVRTSFIFDLPTTTKDDMEKTIQFILETEPDEIRGHFLTPTGTVYTHDVNLNITYTHNWGVVTKTFKVTVTRKVQ